MKAGKDACQVSFQAIQWAIFLWESNINGCLALFLLYCMSILSFLLQFLISVPLQLEQPVEHLEKRIALILVSKWALVFVWASEVLKHWGKHLWVSEWWCGVVARCPLGLKAVLWWEESRDKHCPGIFSDPRLDSSVGFSLVDNVICHPFFVSVKSASALGHSQTNLHWSLSPLSPSWLCLSSVASGHPLPCLGLLGLWKCCACRAGGVPESVLAFLALVRACPSCLGTAFCEFVSVLGGIWDFLTGMKSLVVGLGNATAAKLMWVMNGHFNRAAESQKGNACFHAESLQ